MKVGWLARLIRAGERGFQTSASWKVQLPRPQEMSSTFPHLHEAEALPCNEECGHVQDIWRFRGLGKGTFRVWSLLAGGTPVRAKVLAQSLHMTTKTVRYHLAKLRRHGLALKVVGGWLRGDAAALDAVAEVLGVAGAGAPQEGKHRLDRKDYKESRESWNVKRQRERMGGMAAEGTATGPAGGAA